MSRKSRAVSSYTHDPHLFEGVITYSYIDTAEMYFRRLPAGLLSALVAANAGGNAWPKDCKNQQGDVWGTKVIVQRPSRDAIRVLDQFQGKYRGTLRRLDVAIDIICASDEQKQQLRQWLLAKTLLAWRPKGWMYDDENSVYWTRQHVRLEQGKRQSNRDLVLYADRHSKVTGEVDTVHLELKFLNARSVRREGFRDVKILLKLDPEKLFRKHIRLVEFDFERFDRAMVRRTLNQERQRFLTSKKRPSEFADRFRCNLRKRTEAFFKRIHMNRIQLLKDHWPPKKLQFIDIGVLNIPHKLEWP